MATGVRALTPTWSLGVWSAASGHPEHPMMAAKEWTFYFRLSTDRRLDYRRAAHLLRQSRGRDNVFKAAQILHQAKFKDLSIRLLLRYSMIEEAAGMYIKNNCQSRAAHLYAQNAMWQKAGAIYLGLQDFLRAGHCAVQLGHVKKAARMFRKAGHMRAAAKCYLTVGDRRQAALALGLHGDYELAKNMYATWLRRDPTATQAILSDEEATVITDIVRMQDGGDDLVNLINSNGRTMLLIKKLLEYDQLTLATRIFSDDPALYRERLFRWLEDQPFQSTRVMKLFELSQDNEGMGRLMEYLGVWEEAAEAYHKAGRFESAYECSLKSGDTNLVVKCRSLLPVMVSDFKLPPTPSVLRGDPGLGDDHGKYPTLEITGASVRIENKVLATSPMVARKNFDVSEFYSVFSGDEKEMLWTLGKVKQYRPGEIILDFDESPEGTMTVLAGSVAFEKRDGCSGVAHELSASDNIGEAWSVLSLPSGVRIYATQDCELHVVDRSRVSDLSRTASQSGQALYNRISDRVMRHLLQRAAEPPLESMPVLAL